MSTPKPNPCPRCGKKALTQLSAAELATRKIKDPIVCDLSLGGCARTFRTFTPRTK